MNDADQDGIPDFSDAPGGGLPRAPQLALRRDGTNLWLSLSGDVGVLHEVDQAPAPTGALWTLVSSVVLTNDPHTFALPLPGSNTFWRARAFPP